ncbi:exodeoxyribonuclease VII small subunit [Parapedobacter sp. DT-150]|uniref:exodeoxyribonuclease VII small subunit n=1 Tax=Parapedobacter sp. DT-150 TaxID=3396162 RepID=UPI003F1ADCE2
MSDEKYTYTDAFEELQSIVSEIEQGGISIDALSEKVRRATQLITVCKAKLTATEEEVNNILADLTMDMDAPAPTAGDE